jgi:hypothetical protein
MSRRGRSPPPRPQKSTVSVGRARHAALTDGQDVERAKERVRKRKKAAQEQEASSQGSKASKWDQAPAGFEGMTVGEVAARAPRLLSLPISSSIVNPNQLRQARRLYVGNIPTKVSRGVFLSPSFSDSFSLQVLSEEALLKFFNTAMVAAGKTGIGERPPVVAAQVNADKGYAFLEFEHSKICTECMLFDGIILEGNTLKLRRPKVRFFLLALFVFTCHAGLLASAGHVRRGGSAAGAREARGSQCFGPGAGAVQHHCARLALQAVCGSAAQPSDRGAGQGAAVLLWRIARIQHGARQGQGLLRIL